MKNHILVIDDDAAVRGAFSLILEEAGYCVRVAENGLEGLQMAQARRPDLVFLDLRMPGMDGVETLRRLKALDASLQVYIVTAFATEYMEQLKAAHEEGLQFQLASKPLSSAQIRHIAQSIQPVTGGQPLVLTLYVVSMDDEFKSIVEQLSAVLTALYRPGEWRLDVVEVLHTPESALAHDVYVTPMLVRNQPEPVLKILGDMSQISTLIATIASPHSNGADTIVM